MELDDALDQIAQIRRQIGRTQLFHGYRAAATAFTGWVAVVTASIQPWLVPNPTRNPLAYLLLWSAAAAVSLAVVAAVIVRRHWRSDSELERQTTLAAVEQFAPAIVAGALITCAMAAFAPEVVWMAPALWAVLLAMGIFASQRVLPAATCWIGVFYLLAGVVVIAVGRGPHALAPAIMGVTFGAGQLLAAGALYWTLERAHEAA